MKMVKQLGRISSVMMALTKCYAWWDLKCVMQSSWRNLYYNDALVFIRIMESSGRQTQTSNSMVGFINGSAIKLESNFKCTDGFHLT